MAVLAENTKILIIAGLGGIVPSLIWLWFWLKEDRKKVEPKGLLAVIFLLGIIAVIVVLPIEKFIQANFASHQLQLILWAASEELIKFMAVLIIFVGTNNIDEPIEWPIFMITAALGFAALENALFLVKPISAGTAIVSLLTGQLRFLGATLLHTVSSGILGIAMAVSFHTEGIRREWHMFVGLFFAISLHSVFNFFIMRDSGSDSIKVLAFLWVAAVIVMLLFERVRRMSNIS